jgi:hypothetical protein
MRETYLKIQYVVCWAGCNIPIKDRTFDSWEKALSVYEDNLDKLSLRIEEVSTISKVKIVYPINTRNFSRG